MHLWLIVRPALADRDSVHPNTVRALADEIKEMAEQKLGVEVEVDCDTLRTLIEV
jgi:hypothetical protein